MKKQLLILGLSVFTTGLFSQTVLYSDDFETPSTFSLGATQINEWLINDIYTGTFLPAVPSQPTAISNPNGNYLHPASFFFQGFTTFQSNYQLSGSETMLAAMTTQVSTLGYEEITLNLWRTGGLNGVRIMYQVNGGGWQDSGHTFSGNPTSWQQESFVIPAGDNVAEFSIAFEFDEANASDPDPNHYHSIDEISITGVNDNGVISSTVTSPNNLTLCEGETIEVDFSVTEDQGTINAGNEYTLELSDANGNFFAPIALETITSTDLTGSITATIPGGLSSGTEYRIRVNSSDDIMIGDNNGVNITINPNPTIGAGNDETICDGDIITLTANNPDGATISWDNGVDDGVAFTPSTTETYTVIGVLNGCESTDQVTITVNDSPTVSAGNSQVVCNGQEVTLTANNPDGAIISWSGGITDGEPFVATSTQNYEVTADLNGCIATDVLQITVLSASVPTIDAGADETICEGDEVTLTADNPDGATISWDNSVSDGVAFTPSTTETYTVTGNLNGCVSTDQVTITVNDSPTVSAGDPQVVCEGEEVTLTAVNPDGVTISWDNDVTDGVPFVALSSQNYEVTAVFTNGCTSTDIVLVTVVETPVPTISLNGDGDLEITLTGGQTAEWYLDGVLIPGENDATLTPSENGNYTAFIVEGSCSSEESDAFEVDFVSLYEVSKQTFNVYPNPTSDLLNIQGLSSELNELSTIEVYDINGRVVLSSNFKTQLNVQSLENGVYFLKISGIAQSVKFIKS